MAGTHPIRTLRRGLAVAVCKGSRGVLRALGRGGTSLPGRLAQAIYPDSLAELAADYRVITVSGTNGKTTTSHLISSWLSSAGHEVLTNRSGANLAGGIVAEFAAAAGRKTESTTRRVAVIECDEAALRLVAGALQPEVMVFTNVFRDQLDRYGEVTHTLALLQDAVARAPQATLCLNADDSLIASLAEDSANPVLFYGIDADVGDGEAGASDDFRSDAPYCIRCGHKYEYTSHSFAHLGHFACPACGYKRPNTQVAVSRVVAMDAESTRVELRLEDRIQQRRIPLPALYNAYNYLGAVAALQAFGEPLPEDNTTHPDAFGRMEHFAIGGGVTMILVKNPAGFAQVIDYLCSIQSGYDLLFCLNDAYADGTDISWIWDAPLERLAAAESCASASIFAAGTRKEDLALRLKYAGFAADRVEPVNDLKRFVKDLPTRTRPLIIVPTYTAMMPLRAKLARMAGEHDFWE